MPRKDWVHMSYRQTTYHQAKKSTEQDREGFERIRPQQRLHYVKDCCLVLHYRDRATLLILFLDCSAYSVDAKNNLLRKQHF